MKIGNSLNAEIFYRCRNEFFYKTIIMAPMTKHANAKRIRTVSKRRLTNALP